jgi:Ca-activated chloride channel homolog
MSLQWPLALLALLIGPLLLLVRWWMARRRRRIALRLPSIALVRAALPGRSLWRRRIPVILFVGGLIVLAFSLSRPETTMRLPSNATSILLAIDVSRSMCSTDVSPNRITAAREAAREFVQDQRDGTKIGIVAFSGIAGLLVEPTTDKQQLLAALDTLSTARGTAIGQAILTSLDAIAELNPDVPPTGVMMEGAKDNPGQNAGYQPDTIVVLTDGANTQGVQPVTAAEQAGARRVRVYTIGFGTTQPAPLVCSSDQLGGGGFGGDTRFGGGGGGFGGGGGGFGRALLINEEALKKVAEITGGEYFRAEDAEQLSDVLGDLPSKMITQEEKVEITSWFMLPGVLLLILAIVLSLRWNRPASVQIATAR